MSNLEQTLSIIKPDAVERNLQDEIKRKSKFQKMKQRSFIKYTNLNHFLMNFVTIYHLAP